MRGDLKAWQKGFWAAAAVGIVGCLALAPMDHAQFFKSYLVAYLYWLGMTMGALVFAMIYPLVGGQWGQAVKDALLASVRTLPLVAVLFLPLAFGLADIYPWARPEAAHDEALAHKLVYLNAPFVLGRAAVYFGTWTALGLSVARLSARTDQRLGPASDRLKALCAGGLVWYVASGSMAVIDWVLSLERDYDSTVIGFVVLTGQSLQGLAFAVGATWALRGGFAVEKEAKASRDLGSLLCAVVLLWAYLQYSQLIINWSGDTAKDVPWYLHRAGGGWPWVAGVILLVHFVVPFVVLFMRAVKERPRRLAGVAFALVVAHVLETYWMIVPSYDGAPLGPHWQDLAAFLAVGGLWLGTWSVLVGRSAGQARVEEAAA